MGVQLKLIQIGSFSGRTCIRSIDVQLILHALHISLMSSLLPSSSSVQHCQIVPHESWSLCVLHDVLFVIHVVFVTSVHSTLSVHMFGHLWLISCNCSWDPALKKK